MSVDRKFGAGEGI